MTAEPPFALVPVPPPGAAQVPAPIAPAAAAAGAGVCASPAERLLAAFLAARNPQTRRAYTADVADFARFLGAPSPEAAAQALLQHGPGPANGLALRYKDHLVGRGQAANSVNRKLAALRSLVKVGRVTGLVGWELQVTGLKATPYKDTRGPGRPKLRRVLEGLAERADAKGRRDVAILRLAYDLGLRRKEIVGLDLADVDFEGATLLVLGKGRTDKERLSLPPKTLAALVAWLGHRGAEPGPLFVTLARGGKRGRLTGSGLYFVVRLLGERNGVRLRPHGIRHTAISDVLTAARGDVREARKFSRHKDVKTLMVYDDQRTDGGGKLARRISDGL